ncbi:MAG: AmpD protein [Candidatus Azotimanducaceae bacterium]|jgi:AmpD protein
MQIKEGWLESAKQVVSPNCDARPNAELSLIVVHCISLPAGHFGNDYVEQLFTNRLDCGEHVDFADLRQLRVSSHLLIRRDGLVVQFVPFDQRAWHAGESSFKGRTQCNDFSIGVELEGIDSGEFTDRQYEALTRVCRLLMTSCSIPADHIVGHSDIAPGRKTDPGPRFDWQRLRLSVNA